MGPNLLVNWVGVLYLWFSGPVAIAVMLVSLARAGKRNLNAWQRGYLLGCLAYTITAWVVWFAFTVRP